MKAQIKNTGKERDNLLAEAFTRESVCDFYFLDQGKPTLANLHAIVSV